MPRQRTGTLVPPGVDGIWKARVTQQAEHGSTTRPLYSLGTTDKALAKRKLAKLVAALEAGEDIGVAAEMANAAQSMKEYAEAWIQKREMRGVVSAADERRNLTCHVLPTLGRLQLCDIRSAHIRAVLDDVASKPRERVSGQNPEGPRTSYSRQTIAHVRATMFRLFDAAWREELIESNPVARVPTPPIREVRKERVILTDDEFRRLIACGAIDLELRMASLVARCEGGMRTGDLLRWDWTMIDREQYAECIVPRSKTGAPQSLSVPEVLRPFLRAWWERAGCPVSGPVFPSRRGRTVGRFKSARGNSFASRLRDALFVAGIVRMPPVRVPATQPGTRTDLGKRAEGTKRAPNPADPLYHETATTLPVDFHSFRRAFNTALAEAGLNVQRAMVLAGHSDAKTHLRYVMRTSAMRTVPDAALPMLAPMTAGESSRAVTIAYIPSENLEQFQRATQESNLRPTAPEAVALSS